MIAYEEAVKIAKEYNTEINSCLEYEKVYIFEDVSDEEMIGPQSLVIIKDTGEALPFSEFSSKRIDTGELLFGRYVHVTFSSSENNLGKWTSKGKEL